MEEAEALCDRIAIVANGSLQCIGDSKEVRLTHAGHLTMLSDMTTGSSGCSNTVSTQQCLPQLKARYGGSSVLTVTAAEGEEEAVEQLVRSISPAVNRTYRISGTQKFEMPKQGVRISKVFQAMEHAKSWWSIHAWGLSDTTLEDVFAKVSEESDMSDA
jgi:ABC-type multidrug transport system ATPase subunit